MFDLYDFLLGGLAPMGVAALSFGIGWAASRRPAVAWLAGVLLGYAAGATALDARGTSVGAALERLIEPKVAHQWAPLMALLAIVPAIIGAVLGQRRSLRWLLAALLCAAAPVWMLWGGKYLPTPADRDSGFITTAWSGIEAASILAGVAALLLAAWYLWEATEASAAPRIRSILAILAAVGAAAAAGLTGSFVYAQLFGVLAASLGGCFIAAWLFKVNAGPEAAAGPTILLAGSLLLLAACYSELQPLQAAGIWASIVLAAGWIPGANRSSSKSQLAVRTIACLVPLIVVVCHAGVKFAEIQRQQQEEAESNPYLNL